MGEDRKHSQIHHKGLIFFKFSLFLSHTLKYYLDDPRRFGQKLPNPKIKYTKNAGPGVLFHFLTWEGLETEGSWLEQSLFSVQTAEAEEISLVSSCNTRKVKLPSSVEVQA